MCINVFISTVYQLEQPAGERERERESGPTERPARDDLYDNGYETWTRFNSIFHLCHSLSGKNISLLNFSLYCCWLRSFTNASQTTV